ncbi:hypothetical protein L3X38_000366 [Prunus dulcis]|uniref:Uncharacterized protein n=1 Tax=Prunus dulcis TaxID=3755 RepID=A0AAD4YJX4_PRUDU|nr:hypothetical protein L3X38_000366 [Prunus dulcis]
MSQTQKVQNNSLVEEVKRAGRGPGGMHGSPTLHEADVRNPLPLVATSWDSGCQCFPAAPRRLATASHGCQRALATSRGVPAASHGCQRIPATSHSCQCVLAAPRLVMLHGHSKLLECRSIRYVDKASTHP